MRLLFFGISILFIKVEITSSVIKFNNSENAELCICDSTKIIRNTSDIEGYTEFVSYSPGDEIKLFVSSNTKGFTVEVIKQSIVPASLFKSKSNNGKVQHYNECSFAYGCNWELSEVIKLPLEIQSGYYSIKLSNKNSFFEIPLIVKSRQKSKILCVASTNTWQAYNVWGGASFYRYNLTDTCYKKLNKRWFSPMLSFERPYIEESDKYLGHRFNAELGLIHWLERENYSFDVITDFDIDKDPSILMGYKMVILNTHSEYWSEKALKGLDSYLNSNGNLCYIGANGLHWKVILKDNKIECQKDYDSHTIDGSAGGRWRRDKLNQPEEKTIGVAWDMAGYNTFMPYMVVNDKHWIYNGTGLKNGDLFGKSLNRKYASGHETDKITNNSPRDIILLAKGLNQEAIHEIGKKEKNKNGGAAMVYFERSNGGSVFSTGSITSSGSMLVDSSMSKIVENVITKMLSNYDSLDQKDMEYKLMLIQKNLNYYPSESEFINQGLKLYKLNEISKALNSFNNALKINPNSAITYNNISACYIKQKRWEKANIACLKALEIKPDFKLAQSKLKWLKTIKPEEK